MSGEDDHDWEVQGRVANAPVSGANQVDPTPRYHKRRLRLPGAAVVRALAMLCLGVTAAGIWSWKLDAGETSEQAASGGQGSEGQLQDGQPSDGQSSEEQRYLLPDRLPEGFEPTLARDDGVPTVGGSRGVTSNLVVYGDTGDGDGWDGPLLSVQRVEADPQHWDAVDQAAGGSDREVTIGGRAWDVSDGQRIDDAQHTDGGIRTLVLGVDLDQATFRDAMEHLRDEPAIGAAGLPAGFEELARGPSQMAFPAPSPAGLEGLYLTYASESSSMFLFQAPGHDEGAVPLLRLRHSMAVDEDVDIELWDLEVRGQSAVARRDTPEPERGIGSTGDRSDGQQSEDVPGDSALTLQWYEPDLGAVVQAASRPGDLEELLQFAEGLRVAEPGEVDALLESHEPWDS